MSACRTCGLTEAPVDYEFPVGRNELRKLKQFCKCIKVETLHSCARLSITNARRHLEDAHLLLNNKRISGMLTASFLSVEECGKAKLAIKYLNKGKDVTYEDYVTFFLDHNQKINDGLSVNPRINFGGFFVTDNQKSKEDAMYVSYNFHYRLWKGPWSTDVESLPEYDLLRKGNEKLKKILAHMREAQEGISRIFFSSLLSEIGLAVQTLETEIGAIARKE